MEFLSDDWLNQLAGRLTGIAGSDPEGVATLSIQVSVTAEDDQDAAVDYVLSIGPRGSSVTPGRMLDPSLFLTADRATAQAISAGVLNPRDAFLDGRLRISGDIGSLLAARDQIARLAARH